VVAHKNSYLRGPSLDCPFYFCVPMISVLGFELSSSPFPGGRVAPWVGVFCGVNTHIHASPVTLRRAKQQ